MSNSIKHLARVLLLSAAILGAPVLLAAAPASAAQVPCWKKLLNDWYDGSISKIYPLPCYGEAIDHLPADVEVYSSAKDDILNARAAAARNQAAPPEKTTSATTTTTGTSVTTTAATTPATTAATTPATSTSELTTTPATTTDATPPKKKKGISGVFADLTPGGPQAFPLPLLILGAFAILLVAAGAAGMIWRRYQGRESGTS